MKLVIVESPTKAKTISKFLGPKYRVLSSYGHIRDLPKGDLGVDVENNFKPRYVIPTKARKNVNLLKKEAEKTEEIILATDEDREGEAIAWHLAEILKLDNGKRIVFHEITKEAINNALEKPRQINKNLVDAQQARRILDRIVGYKLSPFLWKKIARHLSAGRVQSVAVRLIVEREKEIEKFKPEEYWLIEALLQQQFPISNFQSPNKSQALSSKSQTKFKALLAKKDGKTITKLGIKNKKEANKILDDLKGAEYKVKKIEKKETRRNPLPPFTTSTLQQESWKKLHWPAKMTMSIAQQLYEKGYITYHRTDSLNLSEQSLKTAKDIILNDFGKQYWSGSFRRFKTKSKGAQEAHEAIRPAMPEKKPDSLPADERQSKLYQLIWQRFIASQMSPAIFGSTNAEIKAKNYTFTASGQALKFDGFLKVYPMKFKENELPKLEENEKLKLLEIIPEQHFTKPPARYNDASLIKVLEENGIGRPSTYAPIISTIQARNYVRKNEQKKFQPTEIGIMVNNMLVKHFPEIVDINFTAKMEQDLDKIAEGKEDWVAVCQNFYLPFSKNLEKKYEEVPKKTLSEEKTDKKCPKCGSPLVVKFGRFGKFYACSAFPKCKYTEPLEKKKLNIKCPKCGIGEIIEKKTKKGKIFYACNRFPECDFALWDKPISEKCPKCGSLLVIKGKKIVCSNKDCDFKKDMAK